MKPTVKVLMSTYNGELYLPEQLQSIYSQKGVDVKLLVRDDGSTDSTLSLLDKEQTKGRLTWYNGLNLRSARSFLQLLADSDNADYYSFSDQDDYWMDDKLLVATTAIETATTEGRPALYLSRTQLADSHLNCLPSTTFVPKLTYEESLTFLFAGGCTMVMNHKLRELVCSYSPEYLHMHDVWIYCVALAVDAFVYYDTTPHMLYRQHSSNVIGLTTSQRLLWIARWKRLLKKEHVRSRMAQELLNGYSQYMPLCNLAYTRMAAQCRDNILARLRFAFSPQVICCRPMVTLSTRLYILFGLY